MCVERIVISISVFTHCWKGKDESDFVNFVGCYGVGWGLGIVLRRAYSLVNSIKL